MDNEFDKAASRLLREAYTGTEPDRELINELGPLAIGALILPWLMRAGPHLLKFGKHALAYAAGTAAVDMVLPDEVPPSPPDFDLGKALEEFDWSNVLVPAGIGAAAVGGKALIDAIKKRKKADVVRKKAPDKYRVEASESSFADAKKGDTFLFDEVGAFVEERGVNIRSAQDVIDYLNQFGQWEIGDSKLGGVLVKIA